MVEPKDPTLRRIREGAGKRQDAIARRLITTSSNVSHKETRYLVTDHSIRFLREYIEACGGSVQVTIQVNGETITI